MTIADEKIIAAISTLTTAIVVLAVMVLKQQRQIAAISQKLHALLALRSAVADCSHDHCEHKHYAAAISTTSPVTHGD